MRAKVSLVSLQGKLAYLFKLAHPFRILTLEIKIRLDVTMSSRDAYPKLL